MGSKQDEDPVASPLIGADRRVSNAEKRLALVAALGSRTLARHDCLRRFLEYVCNQEMAGRGGEIHEYLIGVNVLGRQEGYSTAEDSGVRRQAHSLRQKLQELYSEELRSAPVRIELPKGGYVPTFVRVEAAVAPEVSVLPPSESATPGHSFHRQLIYATAVVSFMVGILATTAFTLRRDRSASAFVNPVLRAAWGPVLDSKADTLVLMDTAVQFLIRQLSVQDKERSPYLVPPIPELRARVLSWYRPVPGTELYMIPTYHSVPWGETAAALIAVGTLSAAGASYQIEPERVSSFFTLRGRNAVVLARPEFSPAATLLLAETPFGIRYSDQAQANAIIRISRNGSLAEMYSDGGDKERFGLISVLRSPGTAPHGARIVFFSGLNSAGVQGAAEYFSSPDKLMAFHEILRRNGYSSWPQAYQIVVKTRSDDTLPVAVEFVSYQVSQR
jgi:hypothetical protein